MPFRMAGFDFVKVCKERLHKVIYPTVAFRFIMPVISYQNSTDFDRSDRRVFRNEFGIILSGYAHGRIISRHISRYRHEMEFLVRSNVLKHPGGLGSDIDHRGDFAPP